MSKEQKMLIQILKRSGLNFRIKLPNEEGGFFYIENGERKKFAKNIFVKRSIKEERNGIMQNEQETT